MHPEEMRELVSEETVELLMIIIAVGAPILGIAGGLIWGVAKRRIWWGLCNGFLLGSLGILNYGLWRFYCYRTRFDPMTGYAGLHRVDVLLQNLLLFIIVGIAVGVLAGLYVRYFRRYWRESEETSSGGGKSNGEDIL